MPSPQYHLTNLPFREACHNLAIVRDFFFFSFREESCKSLGCSRLRVTISCLEDSSLLWSSKLPTPSLVGAGLAEAPPADACRRLLSSLQETGTFSTFCA